VRPCDAVSISSGAALAIIRVDVGDIHPVSVGPHAAIVGIPVVGPVKLRDVVAQEFFVGIFAQGAAGAVIVIIVVVLVPGFDRLANILHLPRPASAPRIGRHRTQDDADIVFIQTVLLVLIIVVVVAVVSKAIVDEIISERVLTLTATTVTVVFVVIVVAVVIAVVVVVVVVVVVDVVVVVARVAGSCASGL
jgi:hypothetical protein